MKAKENRATDMQAPREHDKRPPSPTKVLSQPLKSRNTLLPPTTAAMPQAATHSPEPLDGPLESPAFFMSPATTILEYEGPDGDHISLHDLIEAYCTLSNRIRSQIRNLLGCNTVPSALVPLQEHSAKLGAALVRDLKHIRDEPLDASSSWNPLEPSLEAEKEAEQARITRDNAELGHYVLSLVSEILAFPPLSRVFSAGDLSSMLNELIVLGLASSIPNALANRTWSLVVWTISVQNLPAGILIPVKRQLVSVLARALDGKLGKEVAPMDGIKAATKLLTQNPVPFMTPLSEIFPHILEHLVAEPPNARLHAVNLLGRFALAKLDTPPSSRSHAALSKALTEFLTSQSASRRPMKIQARLRTVITDGLTTKSPQHPACSPFWVVQFLASVVVLLRDSFFDNSAILKLTGESLRTIACHKQNIVIGLHPHIWKCMIWVFSHLVPRETLSVGGTDVREAAFKIVKQELRGDIPFAFIHTLLGASPVDPTSDSDAVTKVLDIVTNMLDSGDVKIQTAAVAVIARLLYVPPTEEALLPFALLAPQLFDGRLLHASPKQVITVARSITRCTPEHIRQLADHEVHAYWDTIADLWCRAIRFCWLRSLEPTAGTDSSPSLAELENDLVLHGWQTLLLVPTEMTQGYGHFTPSAGFSGNTKAASVMCSFLADLPAEPVEQLRRLRLLSKMWRGFRNVFEDHRLEGAAESILEEVMKVKFELADAEVNAEWTALSASLLGVGAPVAVDVIRARDNSTPLETQRRLWASSAASAQGKVAWKDLAYLLSKPLGVWPLSTEEQDIWESLLRTTVSTNGISASMVVERVISEVKDWRRFLSCISNFSNLVYYIDWETRSTLPTEMLDIVKHLLDELYPAQATTPTTLELIRLVGDFFSSCPTDLLVPLVVTLQHTMCTWLQDEQRVQDGVAANRVVNAFYCAPLLKLGKVESSIENLRSISPLLETLADSDSFEKFWAESYHRRDDILAHCPPTLKTCIKAFVDVYGGSLASGLSKDPHSQLESQLVVDSQRIVVASFSQSQSQPVVAGTQDYFADTSRHPVGRTRLAAQTQDSFGDESRYPVGTQSQLVVAHTQDYDADASRLPAEDTTGMEPRMKPDPEDVEESETSTVRKVPSSRDRTAMTVDPRPLSPPREPSVAHRFPSPPVTSPPRPSSPAPPLLTALERLRAVKRRPPDIDILNSSSGLHFGPKHSRSPSPQSSFDQMSVSSSHAASPRKRRRQVKAEPSSSAKRRRISPPASAEPDPLPGLSTLESPRKQTPVIEDGPSPAKRRRISPTSKADSRSLRRPMEPVSSRTRKQASLFVDGPSSSSQQRRSPRLNTQADPSRIPNESNSEPVSRRQTPSIVLSQHAQSEPSLSQRRKKKRKIKEEQARSPRFVLDCVEVPTYAECLRRRRQKRTLMECSLPTPSPSLRSIPMSTPAAPIKQEEQEQEDYESWEAGTVSMADLRFVEDSLEMDHSPEPQEERIEIDSDVQADTPRPEMPQSSASTTRRPQRSITEPIPRNPRDPLPVRRNQTALDEVLDQAMQVVDATDSQQPMENWIDYQKKLTHISVALNDRMARTARREAGT
ncbi:GLOBIN domain-containing protein [Mycena chlorophos]|uniref:GLOBIN domain-containing protein n=1 Tax=Mycena chlorophos TaxID=658473 RepID=A0A8H6VZ79_MYCCL|nr:GLOBIN domain-containing protein [Mycena chlorophos]